MDVSRQKRTQPDAKKDGPVQKVKQLTADSVPNSSPRSEKRKSSGYNNPDHTKNCREGNESHMENDIEKSEANQEAKTRHTDISRVQSLIMDWESRGEEEGRREPTYQLEGGEGGGGGRRKNQLFLDLCGKFDELATKKESEQEDLETGFVRQSEEPNTNMGVSNLGNFNDNYQAKETPEYPTFTSLKFETDNCPSGVKKVKSWKQRI